MNIVTVRDSLFWSYANLGMAHAAVEDGARKYGKRHYIIRNRLWSGLSKGTISPRTFADDERLKMILPQACCYCGDRDRLSLDHLISRKRSGLDRGENFVWACRSCNSSKGAQDVLEWLESREQFPPLLLLRRYLKLAIDNATNQQVMDIEVSEAIDLPFTVSALPHKFPTPDRLTLWVVPLNTST